jgi:hypothetical protein
MLEERENAIRQMPRNAEVIELLKKFSDKGRFPHDNKLSHRKT